MKLAQAGLKLFAAKIIKAILSMLAVIIFSRELGASPLGTYYPLLALLGILAIPTDFGISKATEKRISEVDVTEAKNFLGTAIVIKTIPILIISTGALLSGDYINQYLGADLSVLFVVVLVMAEIEKTGRAVLRGELRVGETAIIEVLRPLCWLTIGYYLYVQGFGVESLVYGYLCGTVLMAIVSWRKISTPIGRPSMLYAKSLYKYSKFSFISNVGGSFYSWMDVGILTVFVVIGSSVSRADIGAYENAWRLSLVVIMLSRSISTTIFPQISKWDAEDTVHKIEELIPIAIIPSILFVIPAFVGMVVLSQDILRILFGPEFVVAWLPLCILTGEKILQSIHLILGRSLQAIDRPDLAAYATIVSVVINLVLNVTLIPKFGITGAAIATLVSFGVNTLLHARYIYQFVEFKFPTLEFVWCTISSIIMGFCVYYSQSFIIISSALDLSVTILFGVIIYGLFVEVSPSIRTITRRFF